MILQNSESSPKFLLSEFLRQEHHHLASAKCSIVIPVGSIPCLPVSLSFPPIRGGRAEAGPGASGGSSPGPRHSGRIPSGGCCAVIRRCDSVRA